MYAGGRTASVSQPERAVLTAPEFARIAGVSRETLACLECYARLLVEWQRAINLVAPSTLSDLWRRHMLDSAQLLPLLPGARSLLDMGSGAGFPGLVLAVMGMEEVHLAESDARKCAFLGEVARRTAPGRVVVHRCRIEDLPPFAVDAVTARALAPLNVLLAHAEPFLKNHTICVFPKGRTLDIELTAAGKKWKFDSERVPSISDPSGTVLRLTHVHHERRDR